MSSCKKIKYVYFARAKFVIVIADQQVLFGRNECYVFVCVISIGSVLLQT